MRWGRNKRAGRVEPGPHYVPRSTARPRLHPTRETAPQALYITPEIIIDKLFNFRSSKIIATLGPATWATEKIAALLHGGVSVVRIIVGMQTLVRGAGTTTRFAGASVRAPCASCGVCRHCWVGAWGRGDQQRSDEVGVVVHSGALNRAPRMA